MAKDKHFVCKACGYIGTAPLLRKGSKAVEWIMWGIFLIPGPFYSIWRHFSAYRLCPKCHAKTLVPIDTTEGQALFDKSVRKWKD